MAIMAVIQRSIARLGLNVRRGFGRVVPEPFVIAVLLTVLVVLIAGARGQPLDAVLQDWSGGGGVWSLLVFAMQMCLMLVLGTALAAAPGVRRVLIAMLDRATSPRMLVGMTAGVAVTLAWLNWSVGLIGGAIVAREAGQLARRRGWVLHYPLLCAAGYCGLMVWHGGLSGSAPLKVTQLGDLQEVLGPELAAKIGALPLSETLFGPLNLWVSGGLLLLAPLVFMLLTPRGEDDPHAQAATAIVDDGPKVVARERNVGLLDTLEDARPITWLLCALIGGALWVRLAGLGLAQLDFNTVNLTLWLLAMLAHGRPRPFLRACQDGIAGCTGVVLQFPLYAGIMGVMVGAGISDDLARVLAEVSPKAFAPVAFASAGLLNLVVPSGGGQWALQGPILLESATLIGIRPADAVMAMAYGDQWTNMLQPFWALPLLAITGVRARDIVGYAALWMLVGGLWIMGVFVWQLP